MESSSYGNYYSNDNVKIFAGNPPLASMADLAMVGNSLNARLAQSTGNAALMAGGSQFGNWQCSADGRQCQRISNASRAGSGGYATKSSCNKACSS